MSAGATLVEERQGADGRRASAATRPLRVALLTNENAPYRVPLYTELGNTEGWQFRVYTCIDREHDRLWEVARDVGFETRKSFSLRYTRNQRVEGGKDYVTRRPVHVPLGVVPDMVRFRPDVVISDEFGARTLLAALTAKMVGHRLIVCSESTPHTESNPSLKQRACAACCGGGSTATSATACRPGSTWKTWGLSRMTSSRLGRLWTWSRSRGKYPRRGETSCGPSGAFGESASSTWGT